MATASVTRLPSSRQRNDPRGDLDDLRCTGRYRGIPRNAQGPRRADRLARGERPGGARGRQPSDSGRQGLCERHGSHDASETEAHYETHQRYHDLQIDVEGREAFKVATGSLTLVQEFDEKDDYDLVDSDASIAGDLADDKFALFVAGEPHMPTLEFPGDGAQPVKKICFKLLADAYWEE